MEGKKLTFVSRLSETGKRLRASVFRYWFDDKASPNSRIPFPKLWAKGEEHDLPFYRFIARQFTSALILEPDASAMEMLFEERESLVSDFVVRSASDKDFSLHGYEGVLIRIERVV